MLPKIVIICFFISINISLFVLEEWLLKEKKPNKKNQSKVKNILLVSHIKFSLLISVYNFPMAPI